MTDYIPQDAYTSEQVRALDGALVAARTLTRLDQIRSEHGNLTHGQQTDELEAQRAWNDAVSIIPGLTRWAQWDEDEFGTVLKILQLHQQRAVGLEYAAETRHITEAISDDKSGRPPATRNGMDAIRDMIQSGERAADFDLVSAYTGIRQDEQRAISDFANGSTLYTSDFANIFAMCLRAESPWFATATIVRADNGRPLVIPNLSADPSTYTPGEGTAITPADPTLGGGTATPVSYKALTFASAESVEDTEFPLMQNIAQSHARALAIAAGAAFTTTVLAGIANGGTATGLGGGSTATFFGADDWTDLLYGRAAPYRARGSFVAANEAILKAAKWTDLNGQRIWQPSNIAGQPDTFDGRPVYEDPALAAPASATKSVIFGDLGRALVIKMAPLRVAVSTDYLFNQDQVAIKSVLRAGIAVVDAAAAAYLVSKNT